MTKALLSIITPTYNCGIYIHRLLDSILCQTYPFVEMYVVDDGSTDNTKDIIESYIPMFQNRGYSLIYIYQENSGQSVAINRALKLIQGEYLTWPDADDWYKSDTALSRLIENLSRESNAGVIRCEADFIDEKYLTKTGETRALSTNTYVWEDCFYRKNGFCIIPGKFVIKVSALEDCILNKNIYVERAAGQNCQILHPLLYTYDCITIRESLYCVLQRSNSHSRNPRSLSQIAEKLRVYARTALNTLDRMHKMPEEERNFYKTEIFNMYKNDIMSLYLRDGNIIKAKEYLSILKKNNISIPYKYSHPLIVGTIYRIMKLIKKL